MLNYDPTERPAGELDWLRLLTAIEAADPNDESEWLEFKAGLDPRTKPGRQALARAIVAFANRDPGRAAQWLRGYAIIVIGLEPGNLVGCAPMDPADLYNAVQPYLVEPAPHWDISNLTYNGRTVIAVTVAPPAAGDPIHVIGKNGEGVADGDVLVRVKGSSRPATSADIRRLTDRAANVGKGLDISIAAKVAGGIRTIEWPPGWVDDWIDAERNRLLAPLAPRSPAPPDPKDLTTPETLAAARKALGTSPTLANILRASDSARNTSRSAYAAMNQALDDVFNIRHEEDRTEYEFRAQVETYLEKCRAQLPEALDVLKSQFARPMILVVTNNTGTNFAQLKVDAHVEGEIFGFEWADELSHLGEHTPRAPRPFGPWSEPRIGTPDVSRYVSSITPQFPLSPGRPGPEIVNGGSCDLRYPAFDLRPHDTFELDRILLVALGPDTSPIRFTWTATATNTDGRVEGAGIIERASEPTDLSAYLTHGYRRPKRA